MTEYYEEGALLYEHSPPMHIKVESPEGAIEGTDLLEDSFTRDDEDSEGSFNQPGSLPGGLPFNVVVVHPSILVPVMSGGDDDIMPVEQNSAVPAALVAGGGGKRKSRFSGAELEVLVSEVTRCESELFGPAGRLRRREREQIWGGILDRVNAVSRVPRTLREVKKRWDDLKRRNGGKLADARHRSCYLPLGGRSSQICPKLQQTHPRMGPRAKAFHPSLSCADTGVGTVEVLESDVLEKEEAGSGRVEERECDEGDSSMEDKLSLGLSLGLAPPSTSERWLPPSPLYSAPFLNGTPQASPQPSLATQNGQLELPPRASWLEDELRGLAEAAVQLGERVEQSVREFGEGFRRDVRTLVASQEALSISLQQNNVLLQRLLALLEAQQQPLGPRAHQPLAGAELVAPAPPPPDILLGTEQPDPPADSAQRGQRFGRGAEQRRRRKR